ncbi:MAG: hypothetical protein R3C19_00265 [Planctomycetaceae bacterium]
MIRNCEVRHHSAGLVPNPAAPRRRGAITAMVLVLLLLTSLLVAQYVRRAVADRRQMKQELQYVQTQQLAGAGVRRATAAMLRGDYNGETWTIPAGVIHQTNTATVLIRVDDSFATVVARYPSNEDLPVQVTRKVKVQK